MNSQAAKASPRWALAVSTNNEWLRPAADSPPVHHPRRRQRPARARLVEDGQQGFFGHAGVVFQLQRGDRLAIAKVAHLANKALARRHRAGRPAGPSRRQGQSARFARRR